MTQPARPPSNRPGFFIVIEGSDGSGKTTLAKRLASGLRDAGYEVCSVREPGGTRLSERVRKTLLDTRSSVSARAELFLYLASRAQLIDEVIRPALKRGEVVIADRFSLSTYAYQSAGRGLPLFQVAGADQFARDGITPDLTVVLQVSESEAEARLSALGARPDRIEQESRPFHRRVRSFYLAWARRRTHHFVLDSTGGAGEVYNKAFKLIVRRLSRQRRQR